MLVAGNKFDDDSVEQLALALVAVGAPRVAELDLSSNLDLVSAQHLHAML